MSQERLRKGTRVGILIGNASRVGVTAEGKEKLTRASPAEAIGILKTAPPTRQKEGTKGEGILVDESYRDNMFPTGSVQGEFRKHGSIRTCSLATTRNVTEKAREHRELAHST